MDYILLYQLIKATIKQDKRWMIILKISFIQKDLFFAC